MVILRPTHKLRSLLPVGTGVDATSDTALGDWYVNRIVVDRQPLLLLVSSASLLSLIVPARDARGLPGRLGTLVEARLRRLGVDAAVVDAEISAMTPVVVRGTIDRSVLGIMVDFAKMMPFHLRQESTREEALEMVEDHLAENPCHAGRGVIFPKVHAPKLLGSKWLHPRRGTGPGTS